VFNWAIQQKNPSGDIIAQSMEKLAARIEAASGGQLMVKAYPGGGVVPAKKEFESAENGLIDMALEHPVWILDRWPYADLFNYRVAGMTAMETLFWNEIGGGIELIREMLGDTNVHTLNGFPMTPEAFLSCTKPINSPADLKGLRLRTAGGGIDGIAFAEMGASIVSIAGGEVYESVQRGVIDGYQFMSPAGDYSNALYEIVDYMYLSPVRQPTDYAYYFVNKDAWDSLTPDLQEILEITFYKTGMEFFQGQIAEDQNAIQFYKDYGVTVEPMAKSVEDLLVTVSARVYGERAAEFPFAAKVIESQDNFMNSIRATYPSGL
jgi:TRAP-type mannitol/chloroaromatic compound transport system substrate-binding protein